ncbi:hypothetical protein SCA6_012305 [Theobroma cacao]
MYSNLKSSIFNLIFSHYRIALGPMTKSTMATHLLHGKLTVRIYGIDTLKYPSGLSLLSKPYTSESKSTFSMNSMHIHTLNFLNFGGYWANAARETIHSPTKENNAMPIRGTRNTVSLPYGSY